MENNERTEFEKRMDSEISDWEIVVDKDKINILMQIHEKIMKYNNMASVNITNIMSIIDPNYPLFSATAQIQVVFYEEKFNEIIEQIKKSLGIQKKIKL